MNSFFIELLSIAIAANPNVDSSYCSLEMDYKNSPQEIKISNKSTLLKDKGFFLSKDKPRFTLQLDSKYSKEQKEQGKSVCAEYTVNATLIRNYEYGKNKKTTFVNERNVTGKSKSFFFKANLENSIGNALKKLPHCHDIIGLNTKV
jgi:hypothetical protein